jgi:hypothetical protein
LAGPASATRSALGDGTDTSDGTHSGDELGTTGTDGETGDADPASETTGTDTGGSTGSGDGTEPDDATELTPALENPVEAMMVDRASAPTLCSSGTGGWCAGESISNYAVQCLGDGGYCSATDIRGRSGSANLAVSTSEWVAISPSGTEQWTRKSCNNSNCDADYGDWIVGRNGTLAFPAESESIAGYYAIRRR